MATSYNERKKERNWDVVERPSCHLRRYGRSTPEILSEILTEMLGLSFRKTIHHSRPIRELRLYQAGVSPRCLLHSKRPGQSFRRAFFRHMLIMLNQVVFQAKEFVQLRLH